MMKFFAWRGSNSSNSTAPDSNNNKQQSSSSSSCATLCARVAPSQKEERDDDGCVSFKALHDAVHHHSNSPDSFSSSRVSTRSLTSVSDESAFSLDRHSTAEEASYLIERGITLYDAGDVHGAQRCWEQVWEDLGTTVQLEMSDNSHDEPLMSASGAGGDIQLRFVQSLRVKVLGYLLFSHLRHDDTGHDKTNQPFSHNSSYNTMAAFYVSQLAGLAKELGDYENDKYTVTDQLLFHFDASPPAELEALWTLLMEGQHWQLALQLAVRRGGTWIDPVTMAKLYYKVSLMGTDIEKSMVSLTTCLALLPSKRVSPSTAALRRSALECLVELEATRRNYDAALEWHRKLLKALPAHSSALEKAKAQYQAVKAVYIPKGDLASAVSHLNRILTHLDKEHHQNSAEDDTKGHAWYRLELLQVKASLEVQRCNWIAALADYEEILEVLEHPKHDAQQDSTTTTSPDVLAKHYYMMGRICVKLGKFDDAIRYFSQELNITQEVVGACSLAVSRILHELAAMYENGLGDNEKALEHYQEALRIEELVIKECRKPHKGIVSLAPRKSTTGSLPRLQDALSQRRETQRCIGRIHYKRGDFDQALASSLPGGAVGLPK